MTKVSLWTSDIEKSHDVMINIIALGRLLIDFPDAATEEERARLEIQGEFHLGEFVNKFCRGSLLMQVSNACSGSSTRNLPPTCIGVDGRNVLKPGVVVAAEFFKRSNFSVEIVYISALPCICLLPLLPRAARERNANSPQRQTAQVGRTTHLSRGSRFFLELLMAWSAQSSI